MNKTADNAPESITTTTNTVCRLLWGADASQVDPDDSRCGLYQDADGPSVAVDVGGFEVRGWPVRKMDGSESVVLRLAENGNGYHVDAESWVQDRIGARITGRDGAKLARIAV